MMMNPVRFWKRLLPIWLLWGVLIASADAVSYSEMPTSTLVSVADGLLQSGQFGEAVQALEEIVARTEGLPSDEGRAALQLARFQLARALYAVGKMEQGVEYLSAYMETQPRESERTALRMLAQGYADIENWEGAVEVSERVINGSDLRGDELLSVSLVYGQALFRLERYEEALQPLTLVVKRSENPKVVLFAQTMLTKSLVETSRWNDLFNLVRQIYRTDSKYDITLNIAFMQAGKSLFDNAVEKDLEEAREGLLNALFLYRIVLPREKLIAFAEDKKATLQAELDRATRLKSRPEKVVELQTEIESIKQSIKTVEDLPPYEEEVTFRVGQIYAELKRYWEGYTLFDHLYQEAPTSEIGEAALMQSALLLYDVGVPELAEKRILSYISEFPNGEYAAPLLIRLMRNGLETEKFDVVTRQRAVVGRVISNANEQNKQYAAELRYLLAFGFFLDADYVSSREQFSIIVDGYEDSPLHPNALYFRGMSSMLRGGYAAARDDFRAYQEMGDHLEYYASAMFREAICLFGMERIPEAEEALTLFIDNFPNDPMVSEAYGMRGDIEAAKEGKDDPATPDVDEYDPHTLDRALINYRMAIETHELPKQASYGAFQGAKVYELERRWQDIIELMNFYLDEVGSEADVAQAVYWIGRAQIEMDQVQEAVGSYLDALERFGNDPSQEGVDKIVGKLVFIAQKYLSVLEEVALAIEMSSKLAQNKEGLGVYYLRLKVALAELEGVDAIAQLGRDLVASDQALESTSPISLALMCDAAIEAEETELMGRLYDYFTTHFEESDLLWQGYRAKAYQQFIEGSYESMLSTVDSVQELFGVADYMGWSQMLKAEALHEMGRYEEAEEAWNALLGVAQWRGYLYAKAHLGMAKARFALKDYTGAHSFYQRTYLLYKAYDHGTWAADGYLGAAECLERLGRNDDLLNTLDEMLNDEYVNTLPQADTARELKKKYGGV